MDFTPYLMVACIWRLLLQTIVTLLAMMNSSTSCQVSQVSGTSTYPSPMRCGEWASLPAVMGLPTFLASLSDLLLAEGTERPFLASIPSNGYFRVFFSPRPDHHL